MARSPEEVLDSALVPFAHNVGEYSRAQTALKLADIARQERRADIREQRDYDTNAADLASKRRMKELNEVERLRLFQHYAEMGVNVESSDTVNQMNKKFRGFQQNRAENLLGHFTKQIEDNQARQQEAIKGIQSTVTKRASTDQNRRALIVTLSDPVASKYIPEKKRMELEKALLSGKDPDAAVQQVYDYMAKDYWFFKGSTPANAAAFYQKYLGEVNTSLDQSKQIDAAIFMKELDDLNRESREMSLQRDKHVSEFAPFLPKESLAATHTAAPPENPNDAFIHDEPPAEMIVPPSAPAARTADTAPPVPQSAGEAFDESGLSGVRDWFKGSNQRISAAQDRFADRIGRNIVDVATGPFMARPSTAAPTAAQVQARSQSLDNKRPLPATADEIEQVKRLAVEQFGVTPEDLAASDEKIRNGDPNAIASFNLILRQLRGQGVGSPPVVSSAPQSAPVLPTQ